MRILIDGRIMAHNYITGVERYLIELVNAFEQLGFRYDLLVPKVSTMRYYQHIWQHTILPIKASKYDILFCPGNIAPIFCAKKTKLVVTIHSIAHKYVPNSYSTAFRMYYNFLLPLFIKRADAIISVSNSAKRDIISFFPYAADKIFVTHMGIDTTKFRINSSIKKEKEILFVGSNNPVKNIKAVLNAFIYLLNRIPHKLIIVGGTFDIFHHQDTYNELLKIPTERIIFVGHINNVERLVELYNSAEVFVLPSLYEAFNLTTLEAMACGCPVITSDIAAFKEIVGDAGIMVNPYDYQLLAETIYEVLTNNELSRSMIEKGLQYVKKFCWKDTARETIKIFNRLI